MPLISLIIPAYNASKTIGDCIGSLLKQTCTDYEIIVVNDGSTDTTANILRQYQPTISIIEQKNAGAAVARNTGAKLAKGEYLIFVDADIIAAPTMLEKMLAALRANPQKSYAYSAFKFGPKIFKLWEFSAERLKQMPYIHTTSLIRKADFPGFDPALKRFQDWDLWLTMLKENHTGIFVPEVLFTVKGGGSMSRWLPKMLYAIPWLPTVKKYTQAQMLIKQKHHL